jgi:hypothetical protein
LDRAALGPSFGLQPLQLSFGTHQLLGGGVQRRARGRGIKLALGLAERLLLEFEIHARHESAG